MSIVWPDNLVEAIARRRAVILLGSGVSANASSATGQRPPTWGIFLQEAYKALGRKVPHILAALSRYDYLSACDFFLSEHGGQWNTLVKRYFVDPKYQIGEIHRAIFELDSRIVVSLNFDKIYDSYAIKTSEGTVIVKTYYDDDIRQAVADSGRYIIKPHGTVDTMSKMIFTLDDYAKARVQHGNFYEILTSLLHTHTFLCLGCGLSDPDMKLIFEDYKYKYQESPHFMTLPLPISDEETKLIEKTRGLNVLSYSARAEHKQLTVGLKALVEQVTIKRGDIAADQNW